MTHTIDDLLTLMARLREPGTGCPWDLKQSYASIAPSTIEEAYEVVDAIESGDLDQLKDELGDLLFQVVFYAQLGKEDGAFDFNDIAAAITAKLLRRHPHVFPDSTLASRVGPDDRPSEASVKDQWEAIKRRERQSQGKAGVLADIPAALPGLQRAVKLQKRAAAVGFDWPDADGVFDKIDEELGELKQALHEGNRDQIEQEFGDLLFTLVNLSRHLQVEPDTALRRCNRKFTQRFQAMERALAARGIDLQAVSAQEWESAWEAAKREAAAVNGGRDERND